MKIFAALLGFLTKTIGPTIAFIAGKKSQSAKELKEKLKAQKTRGKNLHDAALANGNDAASKLRKRASAKRKRANKS